MQCVALFDAGIPLDVICSRWLVTISLVHGRELQSLVGIILMLTLVFSVLM